MNIAEQWGDTDVVDPWNVAAFNLRKKTSQTAVRMS